MRVVGVGDERERGGEKKVYTKYKYHLAAYQITESSALVA